MRRVGTVDSQLKADAFAAAMRKRKIPTQIDAESDRWEIWVVDEERVTEVRAALPQFLDAHPDEASLRECLRKTPPLEAKNPEQAPPVRKPVKREAGAGTGFRLPAGRTLFSAAPVTIALIALSVLVAVVTQFGQNDMLINLLVMGRSGTFREVLARGELWRLLTPIFVHFGVLHLALNMWWLKDLGLMVERALGRMKLVILVVVIAIVSNLAENLLATSGAISGGMSGVVFGLLAYAWIRGRLDLTSGVYVPNQVVMFMGIFFAMCWMGVFKNIANITHTAGLMVGLVWGYIDATRVARS